MTDNQEIFADGLKEIHFLGGLLRLDFFSLDNPVLVQREEGKQEQMFTHNERLRLVLPIPGFLETLDQMLHIRDELQKRGLIENQEFNRN